jgi:CheY-like chemotaxis protein
MILPFSQVLSKASSRTDYVEATQLGPEIKNLYREANVIVMAKLASRDKMRSLLIDGVLVKPVRQYKRVRYYSKSNGLLIIYTSLLLMQLRFKFWDALTKKLSEPRASPGKVLSRSTGKLEFGNAQAILDTAGRRSSAPGSSTAPLSPSLQAKEARLPSSPQVVRLAIPEQRLPKLRVLVVEDNMLNQLVLSALIDKRGHYCVRADNGEAAVNCYIQAAESNNPIDLVFMDLLMPVMSGEEATRQIRKYEKDHNLPRFVTQNAAPSLHHQT